jgi:hypothetical protein
MSHAAMARCRRFEFFGRTFEYSDEIDWQADPVTKRRWPAVYHADVPIHRGDIGFGDVKYVWELNRQQFLIDVGKAWYLGRDPEDLQTVQRLVRSWIIGNPYATGVNWSCALEPAFRVFSWMWAYYLCLEDLDEELHLLWLQSFYDHGRFLEQHLELYSSPYNHLIAEASALYMLGTCFPEFRDADRWRKRGRLVLDGRVGAQFYIDGGSVEQSTFYHHATVGFYLLAGILARAVGDDLSEHTWAAVERGLEFSMKLLQPDGRTPTIGGADDGRPIRMEHLPFWDFRPYHAVGAVLFNRPDFKYIAGRFYEDALWLLGPQGLATFDSMQSAAPDVRSVQLPASGYAVMRTDWSRAADYVCFDVGEQAVGMRTDAVPNSMHGHADCLSLIAWLNGRRVLVDPGLFAYNCGGEWEAHFRETGAHNTAKVDGRDQARHLSGMAWTHSYRAVLEGWSARGERAWCIGSHDGFARGPGGVTHRRAVWLRPDSYLLIYDEFAGVGEHDFSINYQFAPGTLVQTGPTSALFDDAVEMVWASSHSWAPEIASGGAGADDGWIAPSLGLREAAPRIRLSCTATPQLSLLTVIADRGAVSRLSTISQQLGSLVIVQCGSAVDCVAAAGVAPSRPIDTDALLAVCRLSSKDLIETVTTPSSRVHVDTEAIVRLAVAARMTGFHSSPAATPDEDPVSPSNAR